MEKGKGKIMGKNTNKVTNLSEAELALKESVINLINLERNFMDTRDGMLLGAQTHELNILANDSVILRNAAEVLNYLRINLEDEDQ